MGVCGVDELERLRKPADEVAHLEEELIDVERGCRRGN
jgi:hypothetical protein